MVAAPLSHCREQLVGLERARQPQPGCFSPSDLPRGKSQSPPLTRESVAKRFPSRPTIFRYFSEIRLSGFNEYPTRVRLEKAKQLLRGYDLKVKEIAHNCGFVDSNYFYRVLNAAQNVAIGVSATLP